MFYQLPVAAISSHRDPPLINFLFDIRNFDLKTTLLGARVPRVQLVVYLVVHRESVVLVVGGCSGKRV